MKMGVGLLIWSDERQFTGKGRVSLVNFTCMDPKQAAMEGVKEEKGDMNRGGLRG